jgi:hypothetical protein
MGGQDLEKMDNAKELRQQFPSSQSLCCQQGGILWDVAALYPESVQWGSSAPMFFDGAVLDVALKLSQRLLENSTRAHLPSGS